MKKKFATRVLTLFAILTMMTTLFGCDFLDELLEPEQKTYKGTIYNETNKKDENFDNYDGKEDETETEDGKDNKEDETKEDDLLEQEPTTEEKKGAYYFTFDETKQYTISQMDDGGYTIAFTMPSKFIDFTNISKIKKPKEQVVNLKKNSWTGTFYRYLGTDNEKIKVITSIYDLESFESIDAIATMWPSTLTKLQKATATANIKEGNIIYLKVNGYTDATYRIYPYENETGKSAIILAGAKVGEKYMYIELRAEDVFEELNYEDIIVHMFSSAVCTENENVVFE